MFRHETQHSGWESLKPILYESNGILVVSSTTEDAKMLQEQIKGSDVSHVSVAPHDAFSNRDVVVESVQGAVRGKAIDTILFSAGPLSKVLVVDLLDRLPDYIRLIDTGHLFIHLRGQDKK